MFSATVPGVFCDGFPFFCNSSGWCFLQRLTSDFCNIRLVTVVVVVGRRSYVVGGRVYLLNRYRNHLGLSENEAPLAPMVYHNFLLLDGRLGGQIQHIPTAVY